MPYQRTYLIPISVYLSTVWLLACSHNPSRIGQVVDRVSKSLAPTRSESIEAAKIAISKGATNGVSILGKSNGFWQSPYKILIPSELTTAMSYARKIGLGKVVDDFELSLNRAAEAAVAEAKPIFVDAIQSMTFTDIVAIMQGGSHAATDYFRKTSAEQLKKRFQPIVRQAIGKNQVTRTYNDIIVPLTPAARLAGIKIPTVSIEDYVTNEAVTALFQEIEQQEEKIRQDPQQWTSNLLRKVFGYYKNQAKRTQS